MGAEPQSLPRAHASGDHFVSFDAEAPWSNPDREDQELWPENRSLGFALSSLSFGLTSAAEA